MSYPIFVHVIRDAPFVLIGASAGLSGVAGMCVDRVIFDATLVVIEREAGVETQL